MVNNSLKSMILQVNDTTRSTQTGALRNEWIDFKTIQIKIIKVKASTVVNGTRTNIINYKGITKAKVNKEINRLKDPNTGMIFYIEDALEGLWNNLDLKVTEVF